MAWSSVEGLELYVFGLGLICLGFGMDDPHRAAINVFEGRPLIGWVPHTSYRLNSLSKGVV